MTDRIGHCLAQRFEWVHRLVHSREHSGEDAPGDRETLPQESASKAEELEGVSVKLPVVQKLRPGRTPEPGNAQQTLAVFHLEASRNAEENGGGTGQASVTKEEIEAAEQFQRVSRPRILHATGPPGTDTTTTPRAGPTSIVDTDG